MGKSPHILALVPRRHEKVHIDLREPARPVRRARRTHCRRQWTGPRRGGTKPGRDGEIALSIYSPARVDGPW